MFKAHPHLAFITQDKESPKKIKSQKSNRQYSRRMEWMGEPDAEGHREQVDGDEKKVQEAKLLTGT